MMERVYTRILVPLENSPYDEAILAHVRRLARLCDARILLIHVADGWAARNMAQLELRESEELRADRDYLNRLTTMLEKEGFGVDSLLAAGDPTSEIIEAAEREHCDSDRDVHPRPPLHQGPHPRQRGRVGAPPLHDSGAARARLARFGRDEGGGSSALSSTVSAHAQGWLRGRRVCPKLL